MRTRPSANAATALRRTALPLGDAVEAPGDPRGVVDAPLFEVDVDQERKQRSHHGRRADRWNLVVRTSGGPLQQVPRKRRVAAGQVESGQRGDGVRVLLESLEQEGGLLEATLSDTQAREADDRGGAPFRHPLVEVARCLEQLDLRLLPASGGRQDASVVGAAEGGDDVAPPHALGCGAHPLVGARDVVDQLACPEEPAEDLVHRGQLGRLAGAQRGQRLVGEGQSLLDAVGHHEQATEICQGQEFDIGIAESAPDRDRLSEQCLPHLGVRFAEGVDDQQPATLGSILAGFLEDGARSCQPSAPDGPVAKDVSGDPGERACRPARGHGLALPTVDGVGTLVVGRGGGVLALQVQRLGKALQRLARLELGQGELERMASGDGVAIAQGRRALFDQGRAHEPMMARPNQRWCWMDLRLAATPRAPW
jgi:hypothetical protein